LPALFARSASKRRRITPERRRRRLVEAPATEAHKIELVREDSKVKFIMVRALSLLITASGVLLAALSGAEAKTLGIVALIANDALNVAVIAGATDAAKAAGWDVKVTDTQASADQANAAMSSFAVQKVDAMLVLAFASSSIGSGLAAANAAGIPVASWGGEIVPGIVVTVSGQTVGDDSAKYLLGARSATTPTSWR
jgi:ABC-type sugar transport system substrate-binding protein